MEALILKNGEVDLAKLPIMSKEQALSELMDMIEEGKRSRSNGAKCLTPEESRKLILGH